MESFRFGPFTFERGARTWTMNYGLSLVAERHVDTSERAAVIDAFEEDRAAFIREARDRFSAPRIALVDFSTGEDIAYFHSHDMCGMSRGMIDDRARYWIRSADKHASRAVTLTEFAQIVAAHDEPELGWIAGLLLDDVPAIDPAVWRPPASFELRHVVGEGSFTRVSGAKAAALVGVMPQNFRKYTARDNAASRQSMSYAMWHLLLHKLGVQRA